MQRSGNTSNHAAREASASGVASGSGSLWSSILASTERRAIKSTATSKRILVLGSHDSGKSTLIRHLAAASGSPSRHKGKGVDYSDSGPDSASSTAASTLPDLGLNFQYIDDGDEDTTTRLSIFQTSDASATTDDSLLSLALPPDQLRHSVVLIVLDWERPFLFLENLKSWLRGLTDLIQTQEQDGSNKQAEYEVAEAREALESCVRSYTEPVIRNDASTSATTILGTSSLASAAAQDSTLPLPQGTLTTNLGLNIIVLERAAHLTSEQVEYIQQCLRVICLQYGASLFFTSQRQPQTFVRLRAYVLHRLFLPFQSANILSASMGHDTRSMSSAAQSFPFQYRANVLDREQIMVPTGWDTWGKIKILREETDLPAMHQGWGHDMGEPSDESPAVQSTLERYAQILAHLSEEDNSTAASARVDVQDEQDFFRIHHQLLAREAAKDPRKAGMRHNTIRMTESKQAALALNKDDALADTAARFFASAGVVGPMASSSLALSSVEKALQRDVPAPTSTASIESARPANTIRKDSSRVVNGLSDGSASTSGPVSPPSTGGATPQNQVLADFFQSLLSARSTTPTTSKPAVGSHHRSDSRTSTRPQKDSTHQ
ncbi:hypothetical protein EMMF5_000961 [Cystobasidiomycetes sp. EMM_F5]